MNTPCPSPHLFIRAALAILAVTAASGACAQSWPARPVRLVVPFPAGGPNDTIARLAAPPLAEALGQQVVVENRAGAGGNIGAALVAKAPADGYTLLSAGMGSLVVNPILEMVPYDPVRDFTPVALMGFAPNVLVVHPSLPVKSVKELIALARARPGELNYGSGGVGSNPHLSGALFNVLAKTNVVHVPYKGNAPAVTDLIGGQVQLAFLGTPAVQPHLQSGRLRALAQSGETRARALPDLPTIAEAGVPGYALSPWYGVVGPAGLPAAVVNRLASEITRIVRAPEMAARYAAVGADPATASPEEYGARIRADLAQWTKIVRQAGIVTH